MGFTTILLLVYLLLLIIGIFALKEGNWIIFAAIVTIMIMGIVVLGYLWITSPM